MLIRIKIEMTIIDKTEETILIGDDLFICFRIRFRMKWIVIGLIRVNKRFNILIIEIRLSDSNDLLCKMRPIYFNLIDIKILIEWNVTALVSLSHLNIYSRRVWYRVKDKNRYLI